MDTIRKIVDFLSSSQFGVWGWPTIILILGTGILLTVRLKALQVRKFGTMLNTTIVPTFKSVKKGKDGKNSVSAFEAFSTAISGSIGTGNIIGVTSAILTGGPGAVFWMWVSAFFGMVTNYSESVLGLYYRKKNEKGEYCGGPMYYISEGLKLKWLGYLAGVFCIIAAVGMSAVQTDKISETIASTVGNTDLWVKVLICAIVALLIALIILGGIKRIGKVASVLVPFMTIGFFLIAVVLICANISSLPTAIKLIFKYAFNFKSAGAGILGYSMAKIIQKGMARGIFSNEAGLGSSVIAHSASGEKEPVKQGLWGILAVFIDTFVVCTLTALVVLTSYDIEHLTLMQQTNPASADTLVALGAYGDQFGLFGEIAFSIILPIFAFTTILAWAFYGEKCAEFLSQRFGKKVQKVVVIIFKVLYVLLILLSALLTSDLIWQISDISNALMALPNLVALICLSGLVIKITKNYFARKRGEKVEPMLSAYPELNEEFKNELESDTTK